MSNRQVWKWIVSGIFFLWGVSLIANGLYQSSPAGQAAQAASLQEANARAAQLWAGVRAGDPDGHILLHYRLTDLDNSGGGVIWITVTNRWFYLAEGEQQQLRESLEFAWGRALGEYKGPVILVDITGRQV